MSEDTKKEDVKIKVEYNHVTGIITWSGLDFEVNVPELLLIEDWDERSELDRQTSCHGIKQKVNDARAGITLAKGYTLADMIEVMEEVVDHIANGQWNKTKEDGKGKSLSLTNAVSKMKELGKSTKEIKEALAWMFPTIDINTLKF
jgi:hypothetical protein